MKITPTSLTVVSTIRIALIEWVRQHALASSRSSPASQSQGCSSHVVIQVLLAHTAGGSEDLLDFEAVHDYYYLKLNRAFVCMNNRLLSPTPHAVRQQILGRSVTDIEVEEMVKLSLAFDNGVKVIMSLHPNDYVCPEAASFTFRSEKKSERMVIVI
jgi:hypothetical protein